MFGSALLQRTAGANLAKKLGHDDFLKAPAPVQRVELAEMEFAAILRWLGMCSFVQRLHKDVLKEQSTRWKVPTFRAKFKAEGTTFSACIEVHTTTDPVLTFKRADLDALRSYALAVDEPILFAWKFSQFPCWVLIDPTIAQHVDDDTARVELGLALQNDLMFLVAGDLIIHPSPGAGLYLSAKRVTEYADADELGEGIVEALFQFDQVELRDATGAAVKRIPDTIVNTLLPVSELKQESTGDRVTLAFVASGSVTRAQTILQSVISRYSGASTQIDWKAVGRYANILLPYHRLIADLIKYRAFVKNMINVVPQTIPAFLPDDWRPSARNLGPAPSSRSSRRRATRRSRR